MRDPQVVEVALQIVLLEGPQIPTLDGHLLDRTVDDPHGVLRTLQRGHINLTQRVELGVGVHRTAQLVRAHGPQRDRRGLVRVRRDLEDQ